ncbi:MAG: sugar phosphate isomerase/epimerase [Pseudomonadota bacterium]
MTPSTPFSIQLYSARNFPPLSETLATVARLGYTSVEPFGGMFGQVAELEKGLADNGLTAPTAHMGLDDLQGDFEGMVAKAKSIGVGTVIVPAPNGSWQKSTAEWAQIGKDLAAMQEKMATKDLAFAWHNHAVEFEMLDDGKIPLEHLLGDSLLWEADIAWIVKGGAEPKEWLERYSGRVIAAHIKDIAEAGKNEDEDGWADVGDGVMDWPTLWNQSAAAGANVMIAEHDNPSDFERFASRTLAAMKTYAASAA